MKLWKAWYISRISQWENKSKNRGKNSRDCESETQSDAHTTCTLLRTIVGNDVPAAHEKGETHALLCSVYAYTFYLFFFLLNFLFFLGSRMLFECMDRTENRRQKTNRGAFVGSTKRVRLTTKKKRSQENGERGDVRLITARRVAFPAIIIRTQS